MPTKFDIIKLEHPSRFLEGSQKAAGPHAGDRETAHSTSQFCDKGQRSCIGVNDYVRSHTIGYLF
jgi:hypothetical protein